MITEFLIELFGAFISTLVDMMPNIVMPNWLSEMSGFAATIFEFADSMSVWFPTELVNGVGLALLAVFVGAFGIRTIRILISHFTGGGGS